MARAAMVHGWDELTFLHWRYSSDEVQRLLPEGLERALYSAPRSGLHHARAFHDPWPLHRAQLLHVDDELVVAAGLPAPRGEPLVHYSPSVEVRIGWPRDVGDHR